MIGWVKWVGSYVWIFAVGGVVSGAGGHGVGIGVLFFSELGLMMRQQHTF